MEDGSKREFFLTIQTFEEDARTPDLPTPCWDRAGTGQDREGGTDGMVGLGRQKEK